MKRKLYVLTHCGPEENLTPQIFTTLARAEKELEDAYDLSLYEYNSDGEVIKEYEYTEANIYGTIAEIIWPDDTYDRWDIYEVEVNLE